MMKKKYLKKYIFFSMYIALINPIILNCRKQDTPAKNQEKILKKKSDLEVENPQFIKSKQIHTGAINNDKTVSNNIKHKTDAIKEVNLSKKKVSKIKLNPGLNLIGTCINNKCELFSICAISNLGFDYGFDNFGDKRTSFDIGSCIKRAPCSFCGEYLDNIKSIIFYKCKYSIHINEKPCEKIKKENKVTFIEKKGYRIEGDNYDDKGYQILYNTLAKDHCTTIQAQIMSYNDKNSPSNDDYKEIKINEKELKKSPKIKLKPGLNLIGTCINNKCELFGVCVVSNLGFDYGFNGFGDKQTAFNIGSCIKRAPCSFCGKYLGDIKSMIFYKCKYNIHINEEPSEKIKKENEVTFNGKKGFMIKGENYDDSGYKIEDGELTKKGHCSHVNVKLMP